MTRKIIFDLEPLDYASLREQKLCLLKAAEKHPILHGLVHLIDHIQDQAVASGVPEIQVFGRGNCDA